MVIVFIVEPMVEEDISAVSKLERRCFSNPWPQSAYRRELRNPDQNFYIVLRDSGTDQLDGFGNLLGRNGGSTARFNRLMHLSRVRRPGHDGNSSGSGPIVGYAGFWHVFDEAHITTIAVDPGLRGKSLGELLLVAVIEEAIFRGSGYLSLEVRVSNTVALNLYEKYGFTTKGVRPRYYVDDGEDAYVMWSPNIRAAEFRALLDERRIQLRESLHVAADLPAIAAQLVRTRQPGADEPE